MVRKRSEFPCLFSNSHLCHTRVIYFLFYPSARLRCMDSSHSGQHCCCHHFDFCCPHKVPAEQDSGKHPMEQMCLSKQKHNNSSHKPSLGEKKVPLWPGDKAGACQGYVEHPLCSGLALLPPPHEHSSLPHSLHLSELVSAPKAAKLACKLLILTVLPVEDLAF